MPYQPYNDAIEYVEDELTRYLPTRAARINAERMVREMTIPVPDKQTVGQKQQVSVKEYERQAHSYRQQEAQIRHEIDERLAVTRASVGEPGIALDRLNGDLSQDARLILLSLTAMAVGLCDETLGELGVSYYGSASVNDIMTIVDAHTISERLRIRKLILELTGKGFIILDYPHASFTPEEFNFVQAKLSRRAFSVILDDPSLEHEGVVSDEETH